MYGGGGYGGYGGYGPPPPKGPSVSDKLKGWMNDATKALGLDEESRLAEKRKKEEREAEAARAGMPPWAMQQQACCSRCPAPL